MEAEGDGVRVMTVHASKGLEAPIVFLPDTCGAPDGPQRPEAPAAAPGNPGDPPLLRLGAEAAAADREAACAGADRSARSGGGRAPPPALCRDDPGGAAAHRRRLRRRQATPGRMLARPGARGPRGDAVGSPASSTEGRRSCASAKGLRRTDERETARPYRPEADLPAWLSPEPPLRPRPPAFALPRLGSSRRR